MSEKVKMARTNYYFDPAELARLKDYAAQTKTDASEQLRIALKERLDRVIPERAAKVQADAAARKDMTGATFVEGRGWIRPARTNPYT